MANFDCVVEIIKTELWYGRIPSECVWQIVVIITKVNGGFNVIGPVKLIRK